MEAATAQEEAADKDMKPEPQPLLPAPTGSQSRQARATIPSGQPKPAAAAGLPESEEASDEAAVIPEAVQEAPEDGQKTGPEDGPKESLKERPEVAEPEAAAASARLTPDVKARLLISTRDGWVALKLAVARPLPDGGAAAEAVSGPNTSAESTNSAAGNASKALLGMSNKLLTRPEVQPLLTQLEHDDKQPYMGINEVGAGIVNQRHIVVVWKKARKAARRSSGRRSSRSSGPAAAAGEANELQSGNLYCHKDYPFEPVVLIALLQQSSLGGPCATDRPQPSDIPLLLRTLWAEPGVSLLVGVVHTPVPFGSYNGELDVQVQGSFSEGMMLVDASDLRDFCPQGQSNAATLAVARGKLITRHYVDNKVLLREAWCEAFFGEVQASAVFPQDSRAEADNMPVFLADGVPKKWLGNVLVEKLGPAVSPRSTYQEVDLDEVDEFLEGEEKERHQ